MLKQSQRAAAVRVGPVRQPAGHPATERRTGAHGAAQHGGPRGASRDAHQSEGPASPSDDPPRPRRSGSRSGGWGRVLRLGLPLAALATIAAVFWLSRPSYRNAAVTLLDGAKLSSGMEVANPRYIGSTASDEPFQITAVSARPDGPDPKEIALDQVTGDIAMKDGKAATIKASEGVWMRESNRLRLTGGVVLTLSDGYQMETDAMLANIETREVITDGPVTGSGPVGKLEAGRARFQDVDKGVAFFEGGVKVLITKLVKSRATGE